MKTLSLAEIKRHGLVADHMEPVIKRLHRDIKMPDVGSHDRHEVHAVAGREARLGFKQEVIGVVAAGGGKEQFLGHGFAFCRIRAERSAYEFDVAVKTRRHPVNAADERAGTAANHSHPDLSFHLHISCHYGLPVRFEHKWP